MGDKPPNGTRSQWWSEDGSTGFFGHWQDGDLITDRQMNWLQANGGGSTVVGLLLVVVQSCLYVGVPLALIYGLVRFVKWAWVG